MVRECECVRYAWMKSFFCSAASACCCVMTALGRVREVQLGGGRGGRALESERIRISRVHCVSSDDDDDGEEEVNE